MNPSEYHLIVVLVVTVLVGGAIMYGVSYLEAIIKNRRDE
jgi:hypothetical protein